MCATHYNSSSFSVIKPTHLGYYNFPNIRHFDLTLELRTIKFFVLFSSINKDSHSASLQKRLEFIWCSVKVNPHSSFFSLCSHPYSSLSRSWTNSLEGSESQLWEWFPLPGEVETQQSQIPFFIALLISFYIFYLDLILQIILLKYRGQRGWRAYEKMRRVLVPKNPQESLLLIDATAQHQGISQPHYEMCICRSSHSSAAPAWKPLLIHSTLPLFFRSDHSREAKSCFIHQDASPTVLNPSPWKRKLG